MPSCSCPLRACACADIRPTTTNPGARWAPARSISRGCLPRWSRCSCRRLARSMGRGWQLELPGPSWCWPGAAARRCPEPVPANAPRQRGPAARCQRRPAVGRPGRAPPPCGRDRPGAGNPVGPRASGPAVAALAPACRRCCSPRRAPKPYPGARPDGSAQRTCRFERRPQSEPPPAPRHRLSSPGRRGPGCRGPSRRASRRARGRQGATHAAGSARSRAGAVPRVPHARPSSAVRLPARKGGCRWYTFRCPAGECAPRCTGCGRLAAGRARGVEVIGRSLFLSGCSACGASSLRARTMAATLRSSSARRRGCGWSNGGTSRAMSGGTGSPACWWRRRGSRGLSKISRP
jgi:hypothetical protein